ncbi:fatty acid synthase [Trichonephila clavipes]|nr:fatty acid synthase [Trichonephila clavipes]
MQLKTYFVCYYRFLSPAIATGKLVCWGRGRLVFIQGCGVDPGHVSGFSWCRKSIVTLPACQRSLGYNPDELRGRNIGVFVGNSYIDTHEFLLRDAESINENVAPGCVNGLLANRISQVFDFKGTSAVGDSACSSGLVALNLAVQSILRGEVEAAVVGGSNLCLRPGTSIQFLRLGPISDEGVCRTFDADAKGYVRSEAVVSIFLQKSDVARRKYATIIHIKTNTDGYKDNEVGTINENSACVEVGNIIDETPAKRCPNNNYKNY